MNRWLELSGRFYKQHIIGKNNIEFVIEYSTTGKEKYSFIEKILSVHKQPYTHTNTLNHTQMERVWV